MAGHAADAEDVPAGAGRRNFIRGKEIGAATEADTEPWVVVQRRPEQSSQTVDIHPAALSGRHLGKHEAPVADGTPDQEKRRHCEEEKTSSQSLPERDSWRHPRAIFALDGGLRQRGYRVRPLPPGRRRPRCYTSLRFHTLFDL